MLKVLQTNSRYLRKGFINASLKRFFLSNAYKCTEVWEERLKNPVFQKVQADNLYHDLEAKFKGLKRLNVLDVDIFVNILPNAEFQTEIEHVLRNVRYCPESVLLPERTSHAVIRWYIKNMAKEDILNLLGQRMEFGIFPDYYLNNLLMDDFLNEKDFVSAVKIAVLQMLQEDFEHPIMKVLALHCCYSYLNSSQIWETPKEPEPDPDEEVTKVRVWFVRNPYFDDHFDIVNTNHLVGKTLWLFGKSLGGPVGLSSQLIGLVLYEKYDKCKALLDDVTKNNIKIHAEAVSKAKEFALNTPKQPVKKKGEAEDASGVSEGSDSAVESDDENKKTVLQLLENINKENLIEKNILTETDELVKQTVKEHEMNDIQLQLQIYKKWENERELHIEEELKRSEVEKVKSEIESIKKELYKEEQELFYFDHEENLLSKAAKKEEDIKNIRYYRHRIKSKNVEVEYIPPVVY